MQPSVNLNRRQLLRWSVGSLLAAGLWPGAIDADGPGGSEEFHFIQANDLHYIDRGCGQWLERVIRQMRSHTAPIDFCLLVGDLAHEGRAEQLAAVRDIFAKLGKPTHVVIGNHDYLTQADRKAYEQLYPRKLNYHLEHRGWQLVGLDTTEGQASRNTSIQPHTLRWLDDNLARLDKRKPMILFTHFPMGPWVLGRPTNAAAMLTRFKEFNLRAVFNGHLHAFTQRQIGQTIFTTDRCCSFRRPNHDNSKEKGYFLCHAKDGDISRRFVEVSPV
jgi:3',5'-cyclic AMP phosphodiesterase CpdA